MVMARSWKDRFQTEKMQESTICYLDIKDGMHSKEKRASRICLLEEHPELRIQIDPKTFDMFQFDMFICHPNSSVAANVAIKGSDIDGGLIVSQQPIPIEEQLLFVSSLRQQGFDVYHPSELIENDEDISRAVRVNYNKIMFFTHDELLERKHAQMEGKASVVSCDLFVKVYYGGYRIAGEGQALENNLVDTPGRFRTFLEP
jgi:hypothetical protein